MRFFLEIQYDGTQYHGWQKQPNSLAVQEVLDKALSTRLRTPTETVASGRTDAGVHCRQQFVHFDTDNIQAIAGLKRQLNSLLPDDIVISSIRQVVDGAHARFDATARAYRYYIHQDPNPFFQPFSYYFFKELSLEKMNEAAALLCQYQNFLVFSKTKTDVNTFNCDVKEAYWTKLDNGQWEFYIKSNRFLRGMVRLITGALLDIGTGKMNIATLKEWMDNAQLVQHKHSAPAKGLYLCEVHYPSRVFIDESLLP